MKCYLQYAGGLTANYERCVSLTQAKDKFMATAVELARYDQKCEASIHIAKARSLINEYPDYVLSLGPKGGLKCERA